MVEVVLGMTGSVLAPVQMLLLEAGPLADESVESGWWHSVVLPVLALAKSVLLQRRPSACSAQSSPRCLQTCGANPTARTSC